jgi:hypothetical protein
MHSMTRGRPVRFFAILMGGWVLLRIASTVPGTDMEPTSPLQLEPVAAAELITPPLQNIVSTTSSPIRPYFARSAVSKGVVAAEKAPITRAESIGPRPEASFAPLMVEAAQPDQSPSPIQPAPPAFPMSSPASAQGDRWRASAWLLWREGSGNPRDLVTGGRLGGSQAGLRLDYDMTPASISRTAFYGRLSSALNRPASPEGAVGVTWQPARSVPLTIAAERRIALGDGARNANAVFAVGGFGPRPLLGKVEAQAYAQAGMVGFNRRDLFADGKLSLLAPVTRTPVRTGISLSGGAQPQVERLDIGPEVQLRLPMPRAASRLSIEWRGRVAGKASPSSGLAVTLGGDF